MPFRKRVLKNRKRGTELVSYSMPIEEFLNKYNASSSSVKFTKNFMSEMFPAEAYDKYKTREMFMKIETFAREWTHHGKFDGGKHYESILGHKPPKELLYNPPPSNLKEASEIKIKQRDQLSFLDNPFHVKVIGKKLLITPAPAIHNIGGYRDEHFESEYAKLKKEKGLTQFHDLLNILENGFNSPYPEEVGTENAYLKLNKKHRINFEAQGVWKWAKKGITKGDVFSLEMFPKVGRNQRGRFGWKPHEQNSYQINEADPENILSINIQLAEESTEEEKEAKMRFYKENFEKFKIPYRFFILADTRDIEVKTHVGETIEKEAIYERIFPKESPLEKSLTFASLAIIGFLGVIFLSPNLTGNVIGNLTNSTTNYIGAALIILGLIGTYFWKCN